MEKLTTAAAVIIDDVQLGPAQTEIMRTPTNARLSNNQEA